MGLFEELQWRGLVYDATEGAQQSLARERIVGYIGFDPTAPSLHVGSLLMMVALAHMQRHGHSAIALVGGGTGLIGDPSGKTSERQLLTPERVDENVAGIRAQLSRFLDFDSRTNPARLINNAEWLTQLGAIDFMRDIGKHFTINALLAKESIKRRTESEEGISYTEFSYVLLQAYDYLVLHDRLSCTLQMGGSDQWGNITAGMDLIRRIRGAKAHGLVMPLVTTASGAKFGKTEAGTVWLDADLTKPYEFRQFWLNVDDRDAVKYLKFFTFLDRPRIAELEDATKGQPESRLAQRALAREVTRLVHGESAAAEAERAAEKLFKGDLASMSEGELLQVFSSVPSSRTRYQSEGWLVTDFLASNAVTGSKGEAARLIKGGGVYLNGQRVADDRLRVMPTDAIHGRYFVVRKGKKDNFLVRVDREGVSS
jgi:tyrosyl-tRNA synthetase